MGEIEKSKLRKNLYTCRDTPQVKDPHNDRVMAQSYHTCHDTHTENASSDASGGKLPKKLEIRNESGHDPTIARVTLTIIVKTDGVYGVHTVILPPPEL